ncbi:GNAT family N-acetyltransferase [Myroides odoratimimus]|uniref:GNAT family N-acetyltransferase n=1 Tax=Myroides odoratimimus TaxID=76832 RepID=UPI0025755FDC|nr:GNAT family N-acetyltransferase [Myroides odoratimimus]MDM1067370.1 GNAT family N-acetyltransferase [Myroides odoratimimus]MDM1414472.1 GNAT family N-acetyltransferase [Myroides odoratimimus]MDM1446965.1 GNAT family N-acetyltransferase [Myroides odoratimimus]MEC4007602.1 GNAT family N-acetyltransferase [Myroides odoratimimus]
MKIIREMPIVKSDRLVLRELRRSDAPQVFEYFSKDEVTEYYDLATFTTVKQAEELIQIWNDRTINGQGLRWAITLKGNDELIGTCGFHSLSSENSRAEIGYEVTPTYWRKGIASEAVALMLEFGFTTLDLHRIEAFIDPAHDASRRVLQKNGMKTEGVLRDYFFEKGRYVDAELLSILTDK